MTDNISNNTLIFNNNIIVTLFKRLISLKKRKTFKKSPAAQKEYYAAAKIIMVLLGMKNILSASLANRINILINSYADKDKKAAADIVKDTLWREALKKVSKKSKVKKKVNLVV